MPVSNAELGVDPFTPWRKAVSILPPELEERLHRLHPDGLAALEEIRLRVGQPLELCGQTGSSFLHCESGTTSVASEGLVVTSGHIKHVVGQVTQFSMYAVEEDLRRGFMTIPGGHRVGVAGHVVTDGQGQVKSIRSISSLNIRVAHAIPGVANRLRHHLYRKQDGHPYNVLVISPPQCGKTTLIRDIARQWSENLLVRRKVPAKVAIVDERSEIAGCIEGLPQFSVGPRTDVLDGCPKAQGMLMAIRSLSPDIVVTDEIGRSEDALAILEATHAGVAVITTAHALRMEDWRMRPNMDSLFQSKAFDRYILLSRRHGPGTVEAVLDQAGRPIRTGGEGSC
ncbi:stage III sporulation protein AA [Alicyclobacillus fastidiosus]|uniref:Stage III sporulation protein AA n=1 Tax=Alicyclobacillus fastidiosus TaxID=392011 RepID=A0ABY6ZPB5_9BACL|nr:stage III sporulation protein AA [Alicyclobacillus fastidiosus]WAH44287.1 stage III sporulation protein AA [Alicyclobacillus fastidiosus]GMA60611.1 stage III sporulation protein AA [Alicyclobacillus fastidiosus]